METPDNEVIADAVLALVRQRGADSSACPSEVARRLAPDHWRQLMPQVREVASRLATQGEIEITQRGVAVSPQGPWTGPIRLRQPPDT